MAREHNIEVPNQNQIYNQRNFKGFNYKPSRPDFYQQFRGNAYSVNRDSYNAWNTKNGSGVQVV